MRTLPVCLLAVCLLHSALLAAVLHAGVTPKPAEPAPAPVSIALIPPAPPATSAPAPEPEPVSQPVAKPQRRQPELSPRKPQPQAEPETKRFAEAAEPAPTETAPSAATASEAPPAPSEPRFDADYLQNPAPVYPALSRKRGEHGVVLLRVHVLADGSADQIEIFESSGYGRLDDAAVRAVKRWRFVPATLGDETVAAWVRVPVRFDLQR